MLMRQEMMGFGDGSGISWTICKQSAQLAANWVYEQLSAVTIDISADYLSVYFQLNAAYQLNSWEVVKF